MTVPTVSVVTDSVACLPDDVKEHYGVKILSIHFYHGGKDYIDGINVTPSQAYELFLKDPESFKTSAISPGECLAAFREASKHAQNIICITLSSKLSAVYNVAQSAKEQAKIEVPDSVIEVIDSGNVAAAEAFVVLAAAKAAADGKELPEIVRIVEDMKTRVHLVALLETVRHVYRTGRIPKIAALAGSMLNIKPIFSVIGGTPRFLGAVRNKENGIVRILEIMKQHVGTKKVHVGVLHAYAPQEAEKLKERVYRQFDCAEVMIFEFSPIMGYAIGTGALGLAFYTE